MNNKKENNGIFGSLLVYIMLLAASVVLLLSGCGMKQSGLYMVSLEDDPSADHDAADGNSGEAADGADDAGENSESGSAETDIGKTADSVGDTTGSMDVSSDSYDDREGSADEPQSTAVSVIYVHICGEVVNPGVYGLDEGSRVCDAVEAAGGFTENAYQDYVNLAGVLADGTKVVIPGLDEKQELENEPGIQSESGAAENGSTGSTSVSVAGTADGTSDNLVNINTASVSELCTIKGIGETKAEAIVAYRESSGGFENTEQIMNVTGIGEGTYSKIRDKITVGK